MSACETRVKLTQRQEQAQLVLAGDATHCMLFGGSRSGKTFLHIRNIVLRALKAPKSRHAVLRFRFNHVKASVVLDTFPKVMELAFPEVDYSIDKSDWYAKLPNMSQVWFGGLDEKDRTEKILGQEYVTIFLNECSQISLSARNISITRLAQNVVTKMDNREPARLKPRMLYDCNPPSKSHWSYQMFFLKRDPESKKALAAPDDYASFQMNPKDNLVNLAPEYIQTLESLPGRMRRRFLEGVYGEVAPGALWTEEMLDRWRVTDGELPDLQRIVVAVDPSGSDDDDNAENDEIGVMVGALGTDGNGYLLEDLTLKAGPATWGKVVTDAFDRHDADVIVGEKNYGGAMVGYVIDSQPKVNARRRPFKLLTASRGKAVRAEPISALHEQGKVRLAGNFTKLEDELCGFTDHGYTGERSPNRADAFVWLMSELFPGMVKEAAKKPVERPSLARPHLGSGAWMS